jgi:20S proteasome subunit alpha 6
MAIAGLTGDARILCKYMRNECLNYKYVYEGNHPL